MTQLPGRVLIDTGVLIRWLDPAKDSKAPPCLQLVDALLQHRSEVLIAAPSLAEVLRAGGSAPPRRRGITVVPFDDAAATALGKKLPLSKWEAIKVLSGTSNTRLKYDTMIVACAIRHNADVIATLDDKLAQVATAGGMRSAEPLKLLQPQTVIVSVLAPPPKLLPG